jgi:hypothetical protein
MWALGSSMERCLFRSYLEILIDVWTCTNHSYHKTDNSVPVASLSRSLSQVSFLVYRQITSRVSFPHSFIPDHIFPFTRRHPHHSPALPKFKLKFNGLCSLCTLPTTASRTDLTQSKHHIYHRRSSISDHHRPGKRRRPQLWPFTHHRSIRPPPLTTIDLVHSCPVVVGLYGPSIPCASLISQRIGAPLSRTFIHETISFRRQNRQWDGNSWTVSCPMVLEATSVFFPSHARAV